MVSCVTLPLGKQFLKMPDFNEFEKVAEEQKELVIGLVDDFLIYYAARTSRVAPEFDSQLKRSKATVKKLPSNWTALAKSQYIAHRIFKSGGLVNNYIHQPALQARSAAERAFLQRQIECPWRFSFGVVKEAPAAHVYRMEDAFRGDDYYLYSPGMTRLLAEHSARLWLHLIAFNGVCWQSFGPMISFHSFDADDIFFFSGELNPRIESEEDLVAELEGNPLPYMMLMCGASFPQVFHHGDEVVHLQAAVPVDRFSADRLPKDFIASYNKGVYRLALRGWHEFPHYAIAYYHERKQELLLGALTDRGFGKLTGAMQQAGFHIPGADVRVRPQMVQTILQVLNKKINLNPYGQLFENEPEPRAAGQIDKINAVLKLALPYINNHEQPDIDALAAQAGVDPADVREAVEAAIAHAKKMRKNL